MLRNVITPTTAVSMLNRDEVEDSSTTEGLTGRRSLKGVGGVGDGREERGGGGGHGGGNEDGGLRSGAEEGGGNSSWEGDRDGRLPVVSHCSSTRTLTVAPMPLDLMAALMATLEPTSLM